MRLHKEILNTLATELSSGKQKTIVETKSIATLISMITEIAKIKCDSIINEPDYLIKNYYLNAYVKWTISVEKEHGYIILTLTDRINEITCIYSNI